MPSEKQIEAAQKVFLDARPYMGSRELATLMLTAAEQAEPAPAGKWRIFESAASRGWWGIELQDASNDDDPIMPPVKIHRDALARIVEAHNASSFHEPFGYWVKHKYSDGVLLRKPSYIPKADENTSVTPLYTTSANAPAARSGAVKLLDDETKRKLREALRYSASYSVLSSADEQSILAALEPAEPATDVEAYTYFYRYSDPMSGKPVWRSSGGLWNGQHPSETLPLYTRLPESRLREALEGLLAPFSDDPCRLDHHDYCQAHFLELHCCVAKARAALAQEDGR